MVIPPLVDQQRPFLATAALAPYLGSFVTVSSGVKFAHFRLHDFAFLMSILYGQMPRNSQVVASVSQFSGNSGLSFDF